MKGPVYSALLCATLVLAACANMEFDIPPVAENGDGSRHPGRIIWHDLLTDTPEQTRHFYGELFGWQFEPLEGINYTLIRHHGELIGGMLDQNLLPAREDVSQWVTLMSVTDVQSATDELAAAGGTVFTPPTSLGARGDIAVVADPQGAVLGLLQTRRGDPAERSGPPPVGGFLWNELWTADVEQAASFYTGMTGVTSETARLADEHPGIQYKLLSGAGQSRAGIRTRPIADMQPMWVNYLRINDKASLDRLLGRVEALGGKVLAPATERPGGGFVAVIAGPSGAGIALQTWADDESFPSNKER